MDDADRADSRIENAIADALNDARRAPTLKACGACHYCGETVPANHLFCDRDCGDDWENEQAAKRRNGR